MRILIVLITTFLAITITKQSHKLVPITIECPLLLPVELNPHTIIIIDKDDNTDLLIKTCVLKNSHSEQTVILLNPHVKLLAYHPNTSVEYSKTTENPNVIFITKNLTKKIVYNPILKFVTSKWSVLFFVVTTETEFKCNNGTDLSHNDFLLLEDIMNKLWHKHKIMRVGITFPITCRRKLVVYKGKKASNKELYDRSIELVNVTNSKELYDAIKKSGKNLADGYPMKGSIFERYPTSIKNCNNSHYYVSFNPNITLGYCGLDGLVMQDVLSHFKFNLSFPENNNCNSWGYSAKGNGSGSLGCISRKELDISFNARFMTLYGDEQVYYLQYITTDSLCALVKTPDVIPVWHGVFDLYSPELWLVICAVLVVIGFIMWATALLRRSMTGEKTGTFMFYIRDAVSTTMLGWSMRKNSSFLMLRSTCFISAVLFGALYQGHINQVYTTLKRFDKVKTLRQLYESGATLYTSPAMREFMNQLIEPGDKVQEDFFNKAHLVLGPRFGYVLKHDSAATLDRRTDAKMQILANYTKDLGVPMLDFVDECFYTYYLSYIARPGFPFFEDVQVFIIRLNEAGLPPVYYKWTQRMLDIPDSLHKRRNLMEPRRFHKIKLTDLRIAFGILLHGIIVSLIAFAVEMWRGRRCHLTGKRRMS